MCSPSQWSTLKKSIMCRWADILVFVGCRNSWHLSEHTCNEKNSNRESSSSVWRNGSVSTEANVRVPTFQNSKGLLCWLWIKRHWAICSSAQHSESYRRASQVHPSTGWNSNVKNLLIHIPIHFLMLMKSGIGVQQGNCCQRVGSKIFSNGKTHP